MTVLTIMGLGLTATVSLGFISIGVVHDRLAALGQQRVETVRRQMAGVALEPDPVAATVYASVARLPRRTLIPALLILVTDLSGGAVERLRRTANATGIARHIRWQARRRWRHRAQAAQLLGLLPPEDPVRPRLLNDSHPVVRARSAESLDRDDTLALAPRLLGLLADPNAGVRLAAQQALLKGDARLVPYLIDYLGDPDNRGLVLALEVAANLSDPRLDQVVLSYANDQNPQRRAMVATALGNGLHANAGAEAGLAVMLDDDDLGVRVAAIEAAARLQATGLATDLGRLLGDSEWGVRRAAGLSLSRMGPVGRLVLRVHLHNDDRFARDMARQIIDMTDPLGDHSSHPIHRLVDEVDDFPPSSQPAPATVVP